jgi:hypothetical protein
MSKRAALGFCALGLALLAGCTFYVGDPDSPPDPPADPPPDPPVDPPPDPPVNPPPPPPPPPMGDNAPGDEYDPANHRLLVSDCPNNALLALDLTTGERSVLIDTWPWTEPGNEPCVARIVVGRDGTRAFATVWRAFPYPEGGEGASCVARDLVEIDLETREVTSLENIEYDCCSDSCGGRNHSSLQLDEAHGRLLYLESDSHGDYSTHYLSSTPFGADQGAQLRTLYASDCYPDDEACTGEPWTEVSSLTFDPAAPAQRILLLARRYLIGDYLVGQYLVDKLDVATGAITESLPIQLIDGDPAFGKIIDFSVDTEKQRVLLTGGPQAPWIVVAKDLVTGEETLLYDGSPTADGAQLACRPNPAFDSRERRLLLVEPIGAGYDCKNGVFAVDVDTGAFTQIAGRIN